MQTELTDNELSRNGREIIKGLKAEIERLKQSTPSQEGDKAPIDAGKVFDENASICLPAYIGTGCTWFMSREKFIELYLKRIPDAGMEKMIGDAFDAGFKRCNCKWNSMPTHEIDNPSKDQYIKQAMEVINNFKK